MAHPIQQSIHDRLRDPDAAVRRVAVIDLPYTDEEDDIAPLLTAALADTDALVRLEAAKALEGFEDMEVLLALVPLLKDSDAAV
ncbi:MAG TPA: HEAT repeat domain-containing protein, partial [Rhodoferax sp.]